MWLAVDMGYEVVASSQIYAGADAAALAGARWVREDVATAIQKAAQVAAANHAGGKPVLLDANVLNDQAGDIVAGHYHLSTNTFTPATSRSTAVDLNAVRVLARRTSGSPAGPLGLIFGSLFGVNNVNISRRATAVVRGGIGAAGQPQIEASDIFIHGQADANFQRSVQYNGELYQNVDPTPDPLAGLPAVNYLAMRDQGTIRLSGSQTVTAQPGYYSGGITVQSGQLRLQPGIYVLDGAGLSVNGGNLLANGVMFYLVGRGTVNLGGNGVIRISPMDPLVYARRPLVPDEYLRARVSSRHATTRPRAASWEPTTSTSRARST